MSSLICQVEKIVSVEKHPNADRLDIAKVRDWTVIVGKEEFKVGDLCIYLPIDSVLSKELEEKLFKDSKIKLSGGRIRAEKIRGIISYGFCIKPERVGLEGKKEGTDVTKLLGITKYEPPVSMSGRTGLQQATKKQTNPNFKKYTDIENFKNFPTMFNNDDIVWASEKCHGSNARFGFIERYSENVFTKILIKLGLIDRFSFVLGSHNVQLQSKLFYKGFYTKNIYAEMANNYDIKNKIDKGYCVYGEIIGEGIQKHYTYGCKAGEKKLVFFDVMKDGKYLDYKEAKEYILSKGWEFVPVLYEGKYDPEVLKSLTIGDSVYCPTQKVREGIVIKPFKEETGHYGRKVLKLISESYLLNKDNSDNH